MKNFTGFFFCCLFYCLILLSFPEAFEAAQQNKVPTSSEDSQQDQATKSQTQLEEKQEQNYDLGPGNKQQDGEYEIGDVDDSQLKQYTRDAFDKFQEDYSRNYKPRQKQYRYRVFENNLKTIINHNRRRDKTFQMDVNNFADLTDEQFQDNYLMSEDQQSDQDMRMTNPYPRYATYDQDEVPILPNSPMPEKQEPENKKKSKKDPACDSQVENPPTSEQEQVQQASPEQNTESDEQSLGQQKD